jgi:hypothetical protein
MNIIDDFSSYVWTISLRSKDEAATAIKIWHRLTENLSGARLEGKEDGEINVKVEEHRKVNGEGKGKMTGR